MNDQPRDYLTEYLAKPDDFGCDNCDCKDGVCLELRACAQVGAPGLLELLEVGKFCAGKWNKNTQTEGTE